VVLNLVRAKLVRQPRAWRWSSDRATAGVEVAPSWLRVDWVLGQCGRTRWCARRACGQFVAAGRSQKRRPWEQVQGQIYLGSEDFLQYVQEQVGTERRTEIARGHQQLGHPLLAAVVGHVAQAYGQGEAEVRRRTRRSGEARQVAMYATRRIAGRDLWTMGGYFGLSYPAVSRRVHALEVALPHDVRFRKRVDKVLGAINNVKS